MNSIAAVNSCTDLTQQLQIEGVTVRENVSARDLTTICSGGLIRLLAEPQNILQLLSVFRLARENQIGLLILGAGSNLLVPDRGIEDKLVIRLGRGFRRYQVQSNNGLAENTGPETTVSETTVRISVGASMPLMTLSRELSQKGYSGLEFAGGIPASIGGAVRMNAGAHGSDMSSILESVNVVLASGEEKEIQAHNLGFSYRHSVLPEGAIVIGATLKLRVSNVETVEEKRANNLRERKERQPLTQPSFGSVFKNPDLKLTAGQLLEAAGLKSLKIGGAEISGKHANWIINPGKNALTSDILALIETAQRVILEKNGISLLPEVIRW